MSGAYDDDGARPTMLGARTDDVAVRGAVFDLEPGAECFAQGVEYDHGWATFRRRLRRLNSVVSISLPDRRVCQLQLDTLTETGNRPRGRSAASASRRAMKDPEKSERPRALCRGPTMRSRRSYRSTRRA